jgi:hypothetical protein
MGDIGCIGMNYFIFKINGLALTTWHIGFQFWFKLDYLLFIGLAYQEGKDKLFRSIIEYNSLKDFGP